jgi:hypothetical protein
MRGGFTMSTKTQPFGHPTMLPLVEMSSALRILSVKI